MYNALIVDITAFLENLYLAFKMSLKAKGKSSEIALLEKTPINTAEKLRTLTSKGYSEEIIPVLKCDAYGVGSVELAKACHEIGIRKVAVVRLNEALAIKDTGPEILIMNALPVEELEVAIKNRFYLTVYLQGHLDEIEKIAALLKIQAKAHIKVNSGMNRFGIDYDNVDELLEKIEKCRNIKISGIFSHYHFAYSDDQSYTKKQFTRFQKVVSALKTVPDIHLGNSACLMRYPQFITGSSRPGIMLYGSYPDHDMYLANKGLLKPVVEMKSTVIQVREVKNGEYIGYGDSWKLDKDSLLALVPFGYGDGFPRNISKKNKVWIKGRNYPIFGNVCMDSMSVLLDDESRVKVGDDVILFGGCRDGVPSVDEAAHGMNIISYELLTGINKRIKRNYINKPY